MTRNFDVDVWNPSQAELRLELRERREQVLVRLRQHGETRLVRPKQGVRHEHALQRLAAPAPRRVHGRERLRQLERDAERRRVVAEPPHAVPAQPRVGDASGTRVLAPPRLLLARHEAAAHPRLPRRRSLKSLLEPARHRIDVGRQRRQQHGRQRQVRGPVELARERRLAVPALLRARGVQAGPGARRAHDEPRPLAAGEREVRPRLRRRAPLC